MHEQKRAARRAPGGIGQTATHRSHGYCNEWPIALQVWKRSRFLTVGKVVELGAGPVLATVVKGQQGTSEVVSMPIDAVAYAEACGARWWVYRNDRDLTMRRISLAELRRVGIPQQDRELYVPIAGMEPIAWRRWDYVEKTVRLGQDAPEAADEPLQLRLMEVQRG